MLNKIKEFVLKRQIVIFIMYYITLFIDTTCIEIDYPITEIVVGTFRYIIYVFLFIRLLFLLPDYKKAVFSVKWKDKSKLSKLLYLVIGVLLISVFINFIVTQNRRLIFTIFVLLAFYDTNYKKIIKETMSLQVILTSILVLLCILGVTQNYVVGRGEISRYSMGFVYTTNLAQMVLFSSILYMYINGTKTKMQHLFVIQLINVFTYFITNSRSEFILLEMIIVMMMLFKFLAKLKKHIIIKKIKSACASFFTSTFVIYPLLSLLIVLLYPQGGIWNDVNKVLSSRLSQTYDDIVQYGVDPFGQDIEFLGLGIEQKMKYGTYKSNYVDNEYLQLMFLHGYIFIISFIALLNILLYMLYMKKRYKEILLCSIYLLFGLINPRIVNVLYSPILFMIIPTVLEYKKENIKSQSKEEKDSIQCQRKV